MDCQTCAICTVSRAVSVLQGSLLCHVIKCILCSVPLCYCVNQLLITGRSLNFNILLNFAESNKFSVSDIDLEGF